MLGLLLIGSTSIGIVYQRGGPLGNFWNTEHVRSADVQCIAYGDSWFRRDLVADGDRTLVAYHTSLAQTYGATLRQVEAESQPVGKQPTVIALSTSTVVPAREPVPAGTTTILATHYGGGPKWGDVANYNGGVLGCGLYIDQDGDNEYESEDPTIAATGYTSPWGCRTNLMLCGPIGCQAIIVQDVCPGCGTALIDLSEQAHRNVCGYGTCEVTVTEN